MKYSGYMNKTGVFKVALLATITLLGSGCSLNRAIGNNVNKFSVDHVLPAALQLDDIRMICHSNESFVTLLVGFNDFEVDSDLLISVSYAGAPWRDVSWSRRIK